MSRFFAAGSIGIAACLAVGLMPLESQEAPPDAPKIEIWKSKQGTELRAAFIRMEGDTIFMKDETGTLREFSKEIFAPESLKKIEAAIASPKTSPASEEGEESPSSLPLPRFLEGAAFYRKIELKLSVSGAGEASELETSMAIRGRVSAREDGKLDLNSEFSRVGMTLKFPGEGITVLPFVQGLEKSDPRRQEFQRKGRLLLEDWCGGLEDGEFTMTLSSDQEKIVNTEFSMPIRGLTPLAKSLFFEVGMMNAGFEEVPAGGRWESSRIVALPGLGETPVTETYRYTGNEKTDAFAKKHERVKKEKNYAIVEFSAKVPFEMASESGSVEITRWEGKKWIALELDPARDAQGRNIPHPHFSVQRSELNYTAVHRFPGEKGETGDPVKVEGVLSVSH